MKKFKVRYSLHEVYEIEVEAIDEAEARRKYYNGDVDFDNVMPVDTLDDHIVEVKEV